MYYELSALGEGFNLAGKPERIVAVTGKMSTSLLKDEGQLILILTEATQLTWGRQMYLKNCMHGHSFTLLPPKENNFSLCYDL